MTVWVVLYNDMEGRASSNWIIDKVFISRDEAVSYKNASKLKRWMQIEGHEVIKKSDLAQQ